MRPHVMNAEEKKQAMQEARARAVAERQQKRSRKLRIGRYAVYAMDDYNWCVEEVDKAVDEEGNAVPRGAIRYYSFFSDAIKVAYRLCIGDVAADTTDIKKLIDAVKATEIAILQTLSERTTDEAI